MNESSPNPKTVLVVGAGVVGTCCAVSLQRAGFSVTLVDRLPPGEGCSRGNAGHFGTDMIFPMANLPLLSKVPAMLLNPLGPLSIDWRYLPRLLPWLARFMWSARPSQVQRATSALKAINEQSMKAWLPLLDASGAKHLLQQRGYCQVYETRGSEKRARQSISQLAPHGVAAKFLSGDELRELEPSLSERLRCAVYYPDIYHTTEPFEIVKRLAHLFVEQGGRLLKGEVSSVRALGSNQAELLVGEQRLTANKLVIAGGAWSNSLAAQLGNKVPLDTERGYHLMLPGQEHQVSMPVASAERRFVMTPMDCGLRLAGTVEFAGMKRPMNPKRADVLFDNAQHLLKQIEPAATATRWMGFRPTLPDFLPVISRHPEHNQVLFAFGHQHLGLTQGAITGKLIAQMASGQNTTIDVSPFAINRF